MDNDMKTTIEKLEKYASSTPSNGVKHWKPDRRTKCGSDIHSA